MNKADILDEIRRTAAENGGAPPGLATFARASGINRDELVGVHWRTWGDALREAGFVANKLNPRIADDELLEKYARLTLELRHMPVKTDIQMAKRRDSDFPSDDSLIRRFGSYGGLRARVREWCAEHPEYAEVLALIPEPSVSSRSIGDATSRRAGVGFVYLIKHGSRAEYKIGKTLNPIRREGELRLQLPERVTPIHYIETVDPSGVESYWHTRFAMKRKEGEWFALSADDVQEFKRWKRIA
jgi:Meiotically up-regulated gene 113